LPKSLIAQEPINPRDQARLLVLSKKTSQMRHFHFFDLPKLLRPGDVLVFNDSKVIPARLFGHKKDTGGKLEIFLLKKTKDKTWECLIGGKIRSGQQIILNNKITAEAVEQLADGREWLIKFNVGDKKLFTLGEVPLPPYIHKKADFKDYQTVYANQEGSVAAPTAGLHFTKKLLAQLKKQGIVLEFVTLHVGLGTFANVETESILEHKMHSELASISTSTAKRLNKFKQEGRRIIAVGTTAARVLESFSDTRGHVKPQSAWTDIFIYPGYKFKFVDALITNFHLPKSTLLMLVSALAGKGRIDLAYQEAIKKKYRFFSFGDGMMID